MVELQKKYQIGARRFGIINWVGTYSLFKKEVLRFLTVSGQTLFGPILTSILFLTVISLAIGDQRADVLGVSYTKFLASGLIMMQVIQQSFAHSSSSLMMGKMMGTITDVIHSPLSSSEVVFAITFASASSGSIASNSAVEFPTATGSWGTVSHFGIYDASSSGNLLFHGAFSASKAIASGDILKVASGSLTISAT